MIKRNDVLLKGALEDFFPYFLRIIFPDADDIFDFEKELTFLDQELSEITQGADIKHPKVIDKLARVYLQTGSQVCVRVHVEVEKKAKRGFARRMFRYFYRLLDKCEIPVISVAVFLEKRCKNNYPVYNYSFHGTSVDFNFNSIYVAELDEIELSRSVNPFAKILLITKIAIRKGLSTQDLFDRKKAMARQLLNLEISPHEVRKLFDFLNAYLHFEKKEINARFEKELKALTNKSETMGITEQILDIAEQTGVQKGMQAGIQKGKNAGRMEEKIEVSKNMLLKGLDIQLIHELTSLPINKLQQLKNKL